MMSYCQIRCFIGCLLLFAIIPAGAKNQSTLPSAEHTKLEYSNNQLKTLGFTPSDIAEYQRRLMSEAGRWWGHLSPVELMMYSAQSDSERRRFARLYLTTQYPKAQAERMAALAMYEVSREMVLTLGLGLRSPAKKPSLLFVNWRCDSCWQDIKKIVSESVSTVDIYLSGLPANSDAELIAWAKSLSLPPEKVTLNRDDGNYHLRYGEVLKTFRFVEAQ